MVLHFVQREEKSLVKETDNIIAKTALIISNKLILETSISGFIDGLKIITECTDEDFLNYQLSIHPSGTEAYELFSNMQKIFRKFKPKKFGKNAEVMRGYNRLKEHLAGIRKRLKEAAEKEMADKKFGVLTNFFDDERIMPEPVLN